MHVSAIIAGVAALVSLYGGNALFNNLVDVVRYQTKANVAYNDEQAAFDAWQTDEAPGPLEEWVQTSPLKVLIGLSEVQPALTGMGVSWGAWLLSLLFKRKEDSVTPANEAGSDSPLMIESPFITHRKLVVVCSDASIVPLEDEHEITN